MDFIKLKPLEKVFKFYQLFPRGLRLFDLTKNAKIIIIKCIFDSSIRLSMFYHKKNLFISLKLFLKASDLFYKFWKKK